MSFKDQTFQFKALPFGLSSTPWLFIMGGQGIRSHSQPEHGLASVSGRLAGLGYVQGMLCQAQRLGLPPLGRVRLDCKSGKI